jgi:hypothetical protein
MTQRCVPFESCCGSYCKSAAGSRNSCLPAAACQAAVLPGLVRQQQLHACLGNLDRHLCHCNCCFRCRHLVGVLALRRVLLSLLFILTGTVESGPCSSGFFSLGECYACYLRFTFFCCSWSNFPWGECCNIGCDRHVPCQPGRPLPELQKFHVWRKLIGSCWPRVVPGGWRRWLQSLACKSSRHSSLTR